MIRWMNIRIVAGIAILCLFLLSGSAGASPPPAILKIDGNEQTAGIGNSCWKVENEKFSACTDGPGIITPREPLLTRSPFTALLRLPLQESPEELYFNTYRVTDDDELKEFANGVRVWRLKGNAVNMYKRPFEREPEFNLSLAPGLYVFNVGAEWKDKGSVIYGFLVQVNDREAKITNNVSQAFSSTASYSTYAPGDLIISHEDRLYLWEKDVPMVSRECGENMTLLKEGYLVSSS
jgi:hypothetical protein